MKQEGGAIPLTWEQEEMTTLRPRERIVRRNEILDNWERYNLQGISEQFDGEPGTLMINSISLNTRFSHDAKRLDVIFWRNNLLVPFIEEWYMHNELQRVCLHRSGIQDLSFDGKLIHYGQANVVGGGQIIELGIVPGE